MLANTKSSKLPKLFTLVPMTMATKGWTAMGPAFTEFLLLPVGDVDGGKERFVGMLAQTFFQAAAFRFGLRVPRALPITVSQ